MTLPLPSLECGQFGITVDGGIDYRIHSPKPTPEPKPKPTLKPKTKHKPNLTSSSLHQATDNQQTPK